MMLRIFSCSCYLLWKNIDSNPLPIFNWVKVCLVKAMVFPVVMYACASWTVKKAEHWKIDAFELWCWRRLLRVPWTARRSNRSILKEISPGCPLEGLMLKLKLQYFGHLMWRVDSLEKTLMLGGIGAEGEGGDRGWDGWMASLTRWAWVWVNSGSWWWTGRPGVPQFMGSQRVGHDWATERNWLNCSSCLYSLEKRTLSNIRYENSFFHFVEEKFTYSLFTFFIMSFEAQKFTNFDEAQFIYFFFCRFCF